MYKYRIYLIHLFFSFFTRRFSKWPRNWLICLGRLWNFAINVGRCQIWLAKCCKIQQLAPSYSTTYIYFQQHIFIFNILYLYSTIRIFFQLQPKLFSFNKIFVQLQPKIISFNDIICSTSTENNFIQQQYLFNFNHNYFYSTMIIIQLLSCVVIYEHTFSHDKGFQSSRTFKISSFNKIPRPSPRTTPNAVTNP